jgi:hypothetical protein
MKKIIKSSIAVLGICFFATTANAQLASEQAAAARPAAASKSTTISAVEVQTASAMPAAKPAVTKVAVPSTEAAPTAVGVGDFNNEMRLDIVVTNWGVNTVSVLLGYGNGSFANQTTLSTGDDSEPYSLAVSDFNNDTVSDIIVANYASSTVTVFIGDGHGNFTTLEEFSMGNGAHPICLAVNDFNRDKKLDFAVVNYANDDLQIWLQTC